MSIALWSCGDFTGPELPELGSTAGAEFDAQLEVTQAAPTRVLVRVLASNPTNDTIHLWFLGPDCSVRARVYGESVSGQEILASPFADSCATVADFMTLAPGETLPFPDEPEFSLAERLGTAFRPGVYVISAVLEVARTGEPQEEIELHAGRVGAQ
ncbi:MAG: hypothetical protein MJB57_05385 [Gemmatimonadetes bacterium]|nr:hypothetical protein [Gemmatimonadota bacterium]